MIDKKLIRTLRRIRIDWMQGAKSSFNKYQEGKVGTRLIVTNFHPLGFSGVLGYTPVCIRPGDIIIFDISVVYYHPDRIKKIIRATKVIYENN